jgi:glycosyltransferase A (GT-A) superfamily protein (DUF2064 family)
VSVTLLVIAKEPRPGRVKTRLTPPFTPQEAAALAEAALVDTLRTVAATPARRRVLVLDGAPGPWLPAGFDVVRQCAGTLDERLAAAFAGCDGPALLIGMDTPQVTPDLLTVDFADCDAYFGPAEDGGFWALGLAEPDPELLRGVPMSTHTTGAAQRERLVGAGLRVRDLPRLRDVDTAADATAVAALAPEGGFAAELERLGAMAAPAAGQAPRPSAHEASGPLQGQATGPVPGQTPGPTAGRTAGRTTGATADQASGFVAGLRAVRAVGIPAGIGTAPDAGALAGQRGAGR